MNAMRSFSFKTSERGAYPVVFAAAASAPHERFEEYAGAFLTPKTGIGKLPNKQCEDVEKGREYQSETRGRQALTGV